MYVLKGFATYASLCINTPGINNAIGELSSRSITYSTEKGFYRQASISNEISLVSFLSQRDGALIQVPNEIRDHILTVVKSIYNRTISQPGHELDHADHINPIIAEFASSATNFRMGPIISDGSFFMPEWVMWKMNHATESREFQVWFGDDPFSKQYPETEIKVAPPFDNLDDFFLAGQVVEERLRAITVTQQTQRLQALMGNQPGTFIRYEIFDYHDRYNASRIVPSAWGVVIHGVMGNNMDAIKEALVTYILNNSTHTREEWAEILPDIFKRNEFIFAPNWQAYAIPNQVLERGIHSPVITARQLRDVLEYAATDYSPAHIAEFGTTMGYPYRSLAMCSIGHIENRQGLYRINQVFPDWISVPVSQDYNRMSERTKAWSQLLLEMVHAAETFEEFSEIPNGMMKVIRDGKLYLSAPFENLNYLVICKVNFN